MLNFKIYYQCVGNTDLITGDSTYVSNLVLVPESKSVETEEGQKQLKEMELYLVKHGYRAKIADCRGEQLGRQEDKVTAISLSVTGGYRSGVTIFHALYRVLQAPYAQFSVASNFKDLLENGFNIKKHLAFEVMNLFVDNLKNYKDWTMQDFSHYITAWRENAKLGLHIADFSEFELCHEIDKCLQGIAREVVLQEVVLEEKIKNIPSTTSAQTNEKLYAASLHQSLTLKMRSLQPKLNNLKLKPQIPKGTSLKSTEEFFAELKTLIDDFNIKKKSLGNGTLSISATRDLIKQIDDIDGKINGFVHSIPSQFFRKITTSMTQSKEQQSQDASATGFACKGRNTSASH